MTLPFLSRPYETWAPVAGRMLFGFIFLMAASSKIPGTESFALQVAMTGAMGVPFAYIAVVLAFLLEAVGGLALVLGWNTRLFAFLLTILMVILTGVFHSSFTDPMTVANFMTHVGMIAGLLYVSTYGAQKVALATCPLPQELTKKT